MKVKPPFITFVEAVTVHPDDGWTLPGDVLTGHVWSRVGSRFKKTDSFILPLQEGPLEPATSLINKLVKAER